MNKANIRKEYLAKRQALTSERYNELNILLIDNLFNQFDFNQFKCLHTFLSIEKFKEVNTWVIIDRLKIEYPQLKIAVPKMVGDELEHYQYLGREYLRTNDWGIEEPIDSPRIIEAEIDCVLVPLLVFDSQGHRVGYGKGYYDRFLTKAKNATTIGLSLFAGLEEQLAINEYDVPLNYCATPERIYQFKT